VAQVLGLPDVKERLAAMGFEPTPSTPEALTAHMKRETELWSKVIREAQIKTN
jgi:tripartite-type tricarboxylate transporter receptor subunit TctC